MLCSPQDYTLYYFILFKASLFSEDTLILAELAWAFRLQSRSFSDQQPRGEQQLATLSVTFLSLIWDPSSFFGFIGNFLLGYVPYKLWRAISAEELDLRSIKKFALFVGIAVLACILCGIVIGWGLYWLGYTPFMPTVLIIAVTNALWAVIVGSIVLALFYGFVSKRKILYTDIIQQEEKKLSWNKTKSLAILALIVSVVLCIATAIFFSVSPFLLLPFVALSLVATGIACK